MSASKEDRFPLLLVVNMGGPPEKPPLPHPKLSERDLNVSRGAATLISRWPQHVHATSRLAFLVTIASLCVGLAVMALVIYTAELTSDLAGGSGDVGPPAALRRPCREDAALHDGAEVESLAEFMSPLGRAREFIADEGKIFFVVSRGDELTASKVCAVQSAAVANPNSTVYLLVLANEPGESTEDAAVNGSVRFLHVDVPRYLSGTPLRSLWRADKPLRELAVRLVTLWRLGGLALDLDVLTLREATLARRPSKNARLDPAGHVISVSQPCHAFLYQAMRTLARLHLEDWESDGSTPLYNPRSVLATARQVYCRKPHCRNGFVSYRKCPGLKILPEDVVCHGGYPPTHTGCTWTTFDKGNVEGNNLRHFCDFSTTKPETSETNKEALVI